MFDEIDPSVSEFDVIACNLIFSSKKIIYVSMCNHEHSDLNRMENSPFFLILVNSRNELPVIISMIAFYTRYLKKARLFYKKSKKRRTSLKRINFLDMTCNELFLKLTSRIKAKAIEDL